MSLEGTAKAKNVLVGKVSLVDVIQGDSAYEVAVSNGFKGTEEEWLASLKGEKGDTGEKGDKGDRGEKGEKGDSGSGTGDMLASMYDPQGKKTDIFAELANKAPTGFGLGEVTAKELPDANRAVESGYYQCSQNVPAVGWWYLHCISHYDGSKTQHAFSVPSASGILAGTVCKRYMNDGTWGEWEYINPPMQLGVEYRTTERYLGKPVYVCVKEFTGLTSGANFSTGITDGSRMVRYHARWTSALLPFIDQQDLKNSWSIYLNVSNVNTMSLWYGEGTFDTTQTLTVTMYYTKSTD